MSRRVGRLTMIGAFVAAALLIGCEAGGGAMRLGSPSEPEDIYAIRCLTLAGPDRMQTATRAQELLRGVSGLKPNLVQVIHDDDASTVYYGRYTRVYDARAGRESFRPDPMKDLELIRQLSLPAADARSGQAYDWPFLHATIEVLPTPRAANPDWDLGNKRGWWSWHVAVFYNVGEMRQRKTVAEQYCKLLREQGEEAYYYHGPVRSSVCIGLFPREAIQRYESRDPFTGRVTSTNRIVDPRMLELQKRFPNNLENGHRMREVQRDPGTGNVTEKEAAPSFPVLTPWAEAQLSGRVR